MRKAQKKLALEFVETLYQAHEQIKELLDKNNPAQALDLLAQCQQGAIQLGNLIEKSEGEDSVTVGFLEEYCEFIYCTYNEIENNQEKIGNIYKSFRKRVIQIENSIKNDIKEKLEVAFFPYNASMWDSLESIWMAARDDADCDAYVVPIPYFDKKGDGSFGEMHYEGEKYPDYVPVTSWEQYDLEQHRPDIIFIHNPYDEWNLVTSVHPDYFAKNLTRYTDKLVYVPYFVLQEMEPDNQAVIDGIKHFCFLPGTIYGDQVIVQSENMRQIYINEFLKEAKVNDLPVNRKQLEQKILGLGSPKLDKSSRLKKEDLQIPENWRNIIEKPDGSRKKIVFYNTSIATLLMYSEKMLEKMEDVFRIFKENQYEVALLWRPHPLISNTIKSMRPAMWEGYHSIVEKYISEGWGIYDDTADVDRTIVLCDAYYGDTSSLIRVCQQLHKGIMVENPIIVNQPQLNNPPLQFEKTCLQFENLYDDGTCYWFTSWNFNALFKMDKSTWQAEYVTSFPDEEPDGFRLYGTIVGHGTKLYFTPLRANEMAIFDKQSGEITKVSFECLNIGCLKGYSGWNYYSAHLYKDCIYFLPHQRTAVIKYDIRSGQLSSISEWITNITDKYELTAPRLSFRSMMQNEKIYMPISGSNILEVINVETKETQIYQLGDPRNTYGDICFFDSKFWLCPLEGNEIIELDEALETYKTHVYDKDVNNDIQFWGMAATADNLYVFPNKYRDVLTIEADGDDAKISANNSFDINAYGKDVFNDSNYIHCHSDGEKIYAFDQISRMLIEYSGKNQTVRSAHVQMCVEENQNIKHLFEEIYNSLLKKINAGTIIEESKDIHLQNYLNFVLDGSGSDDRKDDNPFDTGRSIYEHVII